MKRLVLLVFLGLVAGQAQAAVVFMTGSKLLEYCENDVGRWGVCAGYVTGIHDITEERFEAGGIRDICMPYGEAGVNVRQLVLVAQKWLEEHPENLHYAASGEVMAAFMDAFPCK